MLLTGINVKTLQGVLGDDVAGHHAAHGHTDGYLGLFLLRYLVSFRPPTQPEWVR